MTWRVRLDGIADVAEAQLCAGCGICASAQPEAIRMVDDLEAGRRPVVAPGADTTMALAACPGVGLDAVPSRPGAIDELRPDWGQVLALWEGHATDDEIRWAGSSGGAATALALHCLEHEGFAGVVHIAARPDRPVLNETVVSTSRAQLLARTGSRYAPASPGDGVVGLTDADSGGRYVFIGKPCDVAGLEKLRGIRPDLVDRIGLTIAIFCAGAPSTNGTIAMLDELGADTDRVTSVRYRGNGWPGRATVQWREGDRDHEASLSYQESWGNVLQKHRPWRCHVCIDHTGEFADVSVGDPWYRPVADGEAGSSLVLARTDAGRSFVESSIESGSLTLRPTSPSTLLDSQPNLLTTRGAVWGRVTTLRVLGLPTPKYRGFGNRRVWTRRLSARERISSVTGTLRRIRRRSLHRRRPVVPTTEQPTTDLGR